MILLVTIHAVQASTIVQGTPRRVGQGTARSYGNYSNPYDLSYDAQTHEFRIALSDFAH